jgi:uncharacterized protein YqhQ
MMRGLQQATVAVRTPSGVIVYRDRPLNARRRTVWAKIPLLRGIQMLGDALVIGMWALQFAAVASADQTDAQPGDELSNRQLIGMASLSISLMIGLFYIAPLLIASAVQAALGWGTVTRELLDSLLRLVLFIGYLLLIRRSGETRRVFGYHGAEHKVVNAYEAGAPLTVAGVRPFTLIHPRCGTSFVLVLLLISVVIFAPLGPLPFGLRLLSRLVLVPLIAGIGYELLRLSARHYDRAWVRSLVAPTLAMQRLTTEPPSDGMLEVAIVALSRVLAADGIAVEAATVPEYAVSSTA